MDNFASSFMFSDCSWIAEIESIVGGLNPFKKPEVSKFEQHSFGKFMIDL